MGIDSLIEKRKKREAEEEYLDSMVEEAIEELPFLLEGNLDTPYKYWNELKEGFPCEWVFCLGFLFIFVYGLGFLFWELVG